jgi:cytochrome c5
MYMTSKKNRLSLLFLILLPIAGGLVIWARANSTASPPLLPSAATASPTRESWLILPEMPSTATQADVGAEIYRLVCSACHGDEGQGLTDEWRAEWNPKDQNCWQSKCHAANHPPEGFILPYYVPPIIGPGTLSRFETTLDLYNYMHTTMPWHDPGSLQEPEYWQLTAFLAREHNVILGDLPLDEDRAAGISLSP